MGVEYGRNGSEEQTGRSATFKVAAGLIGVLGLSLAWMATSFAVGADDFERVDDTHYSGHADDMRLCHTQDGPAMKAVLGAGMYEEFGCDGFFYMAENGDSPVFFQDTGAACGDEGINCDGPKGIIWSDKQDGSCMKLGQNGEIKGKWRLKNHCVGTSTISRRLVAS